MLHYVHVRKRSTIFTPVKLALVTEPGQQFFTSKSVIEVKGGHTVAYRFNDDKKELYYATSRCSKKDNFCKKTGRQLATRRIKVFSTLPYSTFPEGKPTYKNISNYFFNLLKDA